MGERVRLYAWSAPAMNINVLPDHTWVTTYDNRRNAHRDIGAVVGAGENYWFCWGVFWPKGGTPVNPTGALGDAPGDVSMAVCLAEPNQSCRPVRAARGTIFTYGHHGVCHQLANQVLYATASDGHEPLTVAKARGYLWSIFRYGTYGTLQTEWVAKCDSCGGDRE